MSVRTTAEIAALDVRVAILDLRLVAEALASALRAEGFGVEVTASTWTELFEHPEMPVDVAVVDLRLDGGLLIARRVRELHALGTTTVITSARADSGAVATAVRAGALAFVGKGDSIHDLAAAIRAAASGAVHLSGDLQSAIAGSSAKPDPGLGRQEERALLLYAGGRSIREVAVDMQTTEETVKSYLKRGRRKFRDVGIDVGTRILLRRYAAQEGWLGHE